MQDNIKTYVEPLISPVEQSNYISINDQFMQTNENLPNLVSPYLVDLSNSHYYVCIQQISSTKKKRIWNKRDFCLYCLSDVTKISRHFQRHHLGEPDVQKIMSLPVGDKKRKILFGALRNKGNFLKGVNRGYVVPVRNSLVKPEKPTISTHLPCKYCKGFYLRKYLNSHVKRCPLNDQKSTKVRAQSEGQSLLSSYKKDSILRRDVFPTMMADGVAFTAKTDPLICAIAERYLKSHRTKQSKNVASRKMRNLGQFLIELKKKVQVQTLLQTLDPLNFDAIVECTKLMAKYDEKTDTYCTPSIAVHMSTELKDAIDVAYNMLLKKHRGESEGTKKLECLKKLIENEWRYEISTKANQDMHQKKWNKPSSIPFAEDLLLLKEYLNKQSEELRHILTLNPQNKQAFMILQEVCYVQLILLNRKRVGELQRITLAAYCKHINNTSCTEFQKYVSESEKVLMKSFKRIVIMGKRGRGVPILFTGKGSCTSPRTYHLQHYLLKHILYFKT